MFLFIEEENQKQENLRGNKKSNLTITQASIQNIFVKSLHTLSSAAFFCFQHLSNYLRRWICMDAVTNHLRILQLPVLELLWLVDGRQSTYENAQLFMIWNSIWLYGIIPLFISKGDLQWTHCLLICSWTMYLSVALSAASANLTIWAPQKKAWLVSKVGLAKGRRKKARIVVKMCLAKEGY
jgi:uncharacterized membrane protein